MATVMLSIRAAARFTTMSAAAALLAACQTIGQPPGGSAEMRLLAAGYVKDTRYPRSVNANTSYDARYSCAPPACPVRGSVSYFTSQIRSAADGRSAEEQARTQGGGETRQQLQNAADQRGSGRRYTGARNISSGGQVGAESSSVTTRFDGQSSYTRSRSTFRGNTMRTVVSNGGTDAQARRGLALGTE
jgi:hypothetical protein